MSPRSVRIDLAYDGTGYAGWQLQSRNPTLQGALEDVLARISGGRPVRVRAAGRTDSGVHAVQQVATATVYTRLDDRRLQVALAAMLPPAIAAWRVTEVPTAFEPRKAALEKTYQYLIDRRGAADPFLARYALHVPGPLDLAAMAEAVSRLPGKRDWIGFSAASTRVRHTVRHMTRAVWREADGMGVFGFTADGFLTYMVRNLVGTLLDVGRGKFGPERVDRILASGDRGLGGARAAGHGLCLIQVRYAEDEPQVDPTVPWLARSPSIDSPEEQR